MTPNDPPLIRRALTVFAAMMIAAGVIAMHSFMSGHGTMEHPGSIAVPIAGAASHEAMSMPVRVPGSASAPIQHLVAFGGLIPATANDMSAVCLAVLPVLVLLMLLVFVRLRRRQGITPSWAGEPRAWTVIRRRPPRRTTPSLSQLCILRA